MIGFRVLGTGSRDWTDEGSARKALLAAISKVMCTVDWDEHANLVTVVHGNALGADTLLGRVARDLGCHVQAVDAPWEGPCLGRRRLDPLTGEPWCTPGHRRSRRGGGDYCPKAGPRRNQHMVDLGANMCVALPLGPSGGTRDCMRRAEAAHIPVLDASVLDGDPTAAHPRLW